jgi:hypothetical protein
MSKAPKTVSLIAPIAILRVDAPLMVWLVI